MKKTNFDVFNVHLCHIFFLLGTKFIALDSVFLPRLYNRRYSHSIINTKDGVSKNKKIVEIIKNCPIAKD